ncbi:MAG TPA: hypothetical protein VIX87_07370, partial [Steroidobacteraceae bacterium]
MSQTTHGWKGPQSRGSRAWRLVPPASLLVALSALAGCGGDDHCRDCLVHLPPPTPQEVSYGLVAGNFTGNGQTSVIATSTVLYNSQFNTGYLKTYLSTGPGGFAAPVLINDGDDPLYLASADLNGDHLP